MTTEGAQPLEALRQGLHRLVGMSPTTGAVPQSPASLRIQTEMLHDGSGAKNMLCRYAYKQRDYCLNFNAVLSLSAPELYEETFAVAYTCCTIAKQPQLTCRLRCHVLLPS